MHKLNPSLLDWQGLRFLDPVGRVFLHSGQYFRAVYPSRNGFVKSTWKQGVYERAIEAGFLVPCRIEKDIEVEGYGVVLSQERQAFAVASSELCRVQALDYARMILTFNLHLAESGNGYGLIDAHSSNIFQRGTAKPVWIDIGSIRPLKNSDVGLEEFKRLWWRPLKLVEKDARLWRVVRLLLPGGISAEEFAAMGGSGEPQTLSCAGEGIHEVRKRYLNELLESLPATLPPDKTYWAEYHGEEILPKDYKDRGARLNAIRDLVLKIKPKTVIDLACANGLYSFMAARTGASVLAADYDEGAITRCYETARSCVEPLSVTVASYDITARRMKYPQAELVLALAVSHHISLTQGFPFTYLAQQLARFTTRHLITEYMPNGLGATQKPESLPPGYTLEAFLEAFRKCFKKVSVIPADIPSTHSPRIIVHCESPCP